MTARPESVIAKHPGRRGRPEAGVISGVVRRAVRGLLTLMVEEDLPLSLGVARDGRAQGAEIRAEAIACPGGPGAVTSTEPLARVTAEGRAPRVADTRHAEVHAAPCAGARRQ